MMRVESGDAKIFFVLQQQKQKSCTLGIRGFLVFIYLLSSVEVMVVKISVSSNLSWFHPISAVLNRL